MLRGLLYSRAFMAHMCPESCSLYCACCCSSGLQGRPLGMWKL